MGFFKFTPIFGTLASLLTPAWSDKTVSVEVCLTENASTSVATLGTTTITTTVHQTESYVATVTPTYTAQPTPKSVTAGTTVYVTKTTTFPNTGISTFTSTQTVQSTVSVTNTVTLSTSATVDVTITAPQSTSTVPTSPGFLPASSNPNLRKREWSDQGLDIEKRDQFTGYPHTVTCGLLVDIIATNSKTVTASKTATVTASPSTVTKIVTTTSTLTSTYLPAGASTTITASTTLTPITSSFTASTTSTSTSSLTVTVQGPAATFYAACDTNNLLASTSYGNITNAYTDLNSNGYQSQTVLITDNAYDCCVQCIINDDCGGGYFRTDGSNQCVFANPDTCDPNSINVELNTYDAPSVATAFDGYCGVVEVT